MRSGGGDGGNVARVNFYIDGLNLYYGMLKRRHPELKWLDLRAMCESLTTDHQVGHVRYFTAPVKGAAGNPKAPDRQHAYLRALQARGGVSVHMGHFIREREHMKPVDGTEEVEVWKIEEKCSDVNIGSHMLLDAVMSGGEILALISNDADLRIPVRMLTGPQFRREVWVFNPTSRPKCNHLKPTIHLNLRADSLAQLPPLLTNAKGRQIRKPESWL